MPELFTMAPVSPPSTAPAGVPEIKPVIGWPELMEKMLESTNPSTISLAPLFDQFLPNSGFHTTLATKPLALVEIGKPPHALLVVGIDGIVGSVKGAELSGHLAAVFGFA